MDRDSGSTNPREYFDFELEIGEGGPRKYPVSVRSPAGEAHEEMRFPFAEWELENKLLTLENTLLRSGETRRRIPSQEEQPVQDFGQSLLQALLVGEVRTRYAMSLLEARRQNKGLRLKLRIHPPDLARLPWEFLYDPDRDEYLSLSSKTPLVRYLDLHQPVEQLPVSPPLRILGMVSSPRDLPVLDVEHEKRLVEEAIKGLRTSSLIEMTWLEGQTWSDLQEAMWGGPWHVFHFIGHGGFDEASQEGAIALADESGRKHLLGARNLARLLDDHYSLRLALLNSCEGARSSVRDAFSSTAATLVRRGVPAVVAMQYEITDRAAIAFARVFYRAVADGLPVDAAVAAGRTAVSMDSALEWGTPVLYMRSPDGRIFDVSAPSPNAQTTSETEDRRQRDVLSEYREAVESAWASGELTGSSAERLRELASELPLEASVAAVIEREIMGDTAEAIIRHQERPAEENERRKQLHDLYAQARRSHQASRWNAVIEVFDQIRTIDPDYPDSEGLLTSARERLEAQELSRRADAIYEEGLQHLQSGERVEALRSFEEVRRLKPGHRDVETMLSQARHEVSDRTSADTPLARETEGRIPSRPPLAFPGFVRSLIQRPPDQQQSSFPPPYRLAWYLTVALASLVGIVLTVLTRTGMIAEQSLSTGSSYMTPDLANMVTVSPMVCLFVAASIVAYLYPIDWRFAAAFTVLAYVPLLVETFVVMLELGAPYDGMTALFFAVITLPNVFIVAIISLWRRRRRPNANA